MPSSRLTVPEETSCKGRSRYAAMSALRIVATIRSVSGSRKIPRIRAASGAAPRLSGVISARYRTKSSRKVSDSRLHVGDVEIFIHIDLDPDAPISEPPLVCRMSSIAGGSPSCGLAPATGVHRVFGMSPLPRSKNANECDKSVTNARSRTLTKPVGVLKLLF